MEAVVSPFNGPAPLPRGERGRFFGDKAQSLIFGLDAATIASAMARRSPDLSPREHRPGARLAVGCRSADRSPEDRLESRSHTVANRCHTAGYSPPSRGGPGRWVVLGYAMGLLAVSPPAGAQTSARRDEPEAFLNQQRRIEEEIQAQLEAVLPPADRASFDYGGWYGFHLFLFDDGVESSRTFRRNDLRVWSRLTLDGGAHEIFVRARVSYLDYNTGDSYDGNDDDWEGPNLERGYYQLDLRKALSSRADARSGFNAQFKIGRDLVSFGTGYALSTPLDHVQLRAEADDFRLTGLIGRTVGSTQDFEQSRPTTRTRRAFFGAEARYLGLEHHKPFAYALWQADHNRDSYPTPLQDYDYDSFYAGAGSEGELLDNLRYATEWVYETGRSFGHRRFAKRDVIRAWAFDAELEYSFDVPRKPRASVEYMFASGDGGRLLSPTDSVGGNRGDFEDTGFNAFGWRDTGLSFAPRLSNLHAWRSGGSFFAFESTRGGGRLEVGSDGYLFWKNHRDGAVSDPTATGQSGYLGCELDVYANWEITHDLAWTARYGVFFPGSAFEDQTTRTFLLVGMTWSF